MRRQLLLSTGSVTMKQAKIEVFHISQNFDDSFGGPARSVSYLCHYLNLLSVSTRLLSVRLLSYEFNSVIDRFDLNWISFRYKYFKRIRYAPLLKKFLETHACSQTILHVHNPWNYIPFLVYKISKKNNCPYVVSARGSFYEWSLKQGKIQKFLAWHFFQRNMLNDASCMHATEINEVKALRKIGVTSPIALIPNGIDLSEFEDMGSKSKSKNNLSLDVSKKYVLFISRIHPKKGLDYLIHSFSELASEYSSYDLLIVGPVDDSDYYKVILKLIVDYGLKDRIHFFGMLRGRRRIDAYNASTIFALPSHTENFGLVIAEALAARLPVITTHGTPWEEIESMDAGWWVELKQESIDNALRQAFSATSDHLNQKGLNGYALIKKYEWKHQAKKMKKLYEWILGKIQTPDFIFEVDKNR